MHAKSYANPGSPDSTRSPKEGTAVGRNAAWLVCASLTLTAKGSVARQTGTEFIPTIFAKGSCVESLLSRYRPHPSSNHATFSTLDPVKLSKQTLNMYRIKWGGTTPNFVRLDKNVMFYNIRMSTSQSMEAFDILPSFWIRSAL